MNKNEQIRESLHLNPNQKVVLIVGGGDGVGKIVKITNEIAKSLSKRSAKPHKEEKKEKENKENNEEEEYQLVVICGSNNKTKEKLIKLKHESKCKWGNVNVEILDYVDNMHEYMCASECIVTKVCFCVLVFPSQ